jgi:hypothetical protein
MPGYFHEHKDELRNENHNQIICSSVSFLVSTHHTHSAAYTYEQATEYIQSPIETPCSKHQMSQFLKEQPSQEEFPLLPGS